MFDKKTLDLYKKLFGNIFIITAEFNQNAGGIVYARIGSNKVKAKCLSAVRINDECVAFKDNNNQYFLLSSEQNIPQTSDKIIAYERRIPSKKKRLIYLVKTISANGLSFWLGGSKRDTAIINRNPQFAASYITNLGSDKYNSAINLAGFPIEYIYKTQLEEDSFFSPSGDYGDYLGNGLWEFESFNQQRHTAVGETIYPHAITKTNSDSPLEDECSLQYQSQSDRTLIVPTWTPENPSSPFRYSKELTEITFNPDPDIGERNPDGIIIYTETISSTFGVRTGKASINPTQNDLYFFEFWSEEEKAGNFTNDPGSTCNIATSSDVVGFVAITQGSNTFSIQDINIENNLIEIVSKRTFNLQQTIYRSIRGESGCTWNVVATRSPPGLRSFTEYVTIARTGSNRISVTRVYDDNGETESRSEAVNIEYQRFRPSIFDFTRITYKDFAPQQVLGDFTNPVSTIVGDVDAQNSFSESLSFDFPNLQPGFTTASGTFIIDQQLEFISYPEDACSLKGEVKSRTFREDYSGTFLAQKTSDGHILQSVSGQKTTRITYDGNPPIVTQSNTNTLILNHDGQSINLNISPHLITKTYNITSTLNETSTQLTFIATLYKDDNLLQTASEVQFAIGSKYVFNPTVNNIPYLVRGVVNSIIGSNGNFTFSCTVNSVQQTKTSFLNTFLLDEKSFYNYLFRFNFAQVISDEKLKKTILNSFLGGEFGELNVILTPSIYKNDNIIQNKIYSVVETIRDIAFVEEWEITESGNIKFNKVFRTPYFPLNTNSISLSNSYHPQR